MISTQTGRVVQDFYTTGLTWSSTHLLDGENPVLFEAGFACAANLYARDLVSLLGNRQPAVLFLSHVHWDHCGAVSYLKDTFPALKIAASARAAEILKRPNAVRLMKELSRYAVPLVAAAVGLDQEQLNREPFRPFEVDIVLKDGQVIELAENMHVEVLATPGHTRDHLSYYIPERKILIGTEATGCMDRMGKIIPEFIVDYDAYMVSIAKLSTLPADVVCQGHHFIFVGEDEIKAFFTRSMTAAEQFKDHVFELLEKESGSIERVMGRIKAEDYDVNTAVKQPEKPYLLNLEARITHLAERWKSERPDRQGGRRL